MTQTHEVVDESLTEQDLRPASKGLSARGIGVILLGLLLLGALGFFSLGTLAKPKTKSRDRGQQAVPVSVATVTQQAVPIQLQAIGNVQAENTVSVTSQVSGKVTGVYFQKGQEVQKGQLLFTLDDQAQLAVIQQAQGTLQRDLAQVQQAKAVINKDLTQVQQATANRARDQAQAKFAQTQENRYRDLYHQGAVSLEQAQQYSTNREAAEATVDADNQAIANAKAAMQVDEEAIKNAQGVISSDEGVLKNAQVQLSYTKIYAPISGRAGNILITLGNVVQPGSNPLVTIAQVHPIQVAFSVPESELPKIQKYTQDNKLKVSVTFPNSNTAPIPGVLTFINNTVDNTTGMIQLMGNFDNTQGQLWPGQYVNTTLTLTTDQNAIVVPEQAVQNGTNGQFVFVVNPDMTVANIPVTVSTTYNGLDVIDKGLQLGDRVVTDGQANLIAGNKVQIKTASPHQ